jgi:hypothetical protein
MGRALSIHETEESAYKFTSGSLKEEKHLENLDIKIRQH